MKKLKRTTTKEQVLHSLRDSIFKGSLKKGQEITQEEIANTLGVSRMPVREAFQVLNREGLIHIRGSRRVEVIGLTKEEVAVHYDIRAFLEGMAAEKACDHPEYFEQLEAIHHNLKIANRNNYVELNEELHRMIWKAANSTRLYTILSDLWNGLQPQFSDFVNFQINKSAEEHKQIVNSILQQNKTGASEQAYNHVIRTKKDFLNNVKINEPGED